MEAKQPTQKHSIRRISKVLSVLGPVTLDEVTAALVLCAVTEEKNMTAAARRVGVCRDTAHKWLGVAYTQDLQAGAGE